MRVRAIANAAAGLLATAAVAVLLAGCSSSPGAPTQTPMQQAVAQLQSEDNGTHPGSDYQAALTALTKQCTQTDPVQLANMTDAVESGLAKTGVSEDRLSLLQHFSASIPAGSKPMNCVDVFAAYETLREGQ